MREVDQFFAGKRVWSVIKDEVFANYMRPYLAKVNRLRRPILLVDCFAGPGIFDDGKEGSPLQVCAAADQYAHGNYTALFVNHSAVYHNKLQQVLRERGYHHGIPIHGSAEQVLTKLPQSLGNQTVLLYLDPFGLSGNNYDLLRPFLQREGEPSTELIINVHMPVVHRLAARNALNRSQTPDRRLAAFHSRLTRTFGGEYWQEVMWDESLTASERDWKLIEKYTDKLRNSLPFVGFCPVREAGETRIKYFIVFASRHHHALLLMNDIMAKAYYSHIHRQATVGGLWENTPWATTQQQRIGGATVKDLQPLIVDTVTQFAGASREQVWLQIVSKQFMRFTQKEFNNAVHELILAGRVRCPPDPTTKRINKQCSMYPI